MDRKLIKNCTLVNRGKRWEHASLLIEGERIKQIFKDGDPLPEANYVLDASEMICLPGIIDDQVHFRDPGLTHKGDIESESRAALLGGVTSYMDMPNTIPQTTTVEAWQEKMKSAAQKSWVNFAFYFGATNDNIEEIRSINSEHLPGIKIFMGASTGNMLVDNDMTLREIFSLSKGIIATHCEDEEMIRENKARFIAKYGDDPDVKWHPYIRSREACITSSKKAIALAEASGANLHILHLSTAEEIELIRQSPKHISGEICVHHLWFEEQDYECLGTRIKWNPAIKSADDREALRKAVRDGIINVIATDHAPHLPKEKEGGALTAASGGPLIQHSLVMMLELVRKGVFTLERVVEVMCHGPAERFGIRDRGYLDVGAYADIVLIRPNDPWVVSQKNIASKCGWSPLEGHKFTDRVAHVFLNGKHLLREGNINQEIPLSAQPLTF